MSDLTYAYDGSFDGLLCCVFESYAHKEIPVDILPPNAANGSLFPVKAIATDREKARRVRDSIPAKIGKPALDLARQAFLTCLARKELRILLFLRHGYRRGPVVMRDVTHDAVHPLVKAVRHLERESHLFKGFIRFSSRGGVLAAEIAPKNSVLPLLAKHFCERFPEERFLIYDKTNKLGLVYQPYRFAIVPIAALTQPGPDAAEADYRRLWRTFYDAIEIKERRNPRCRMTQMPKRYWGEMTELDRTDERPEAPGALARGVKKIDGPRKNDL